jgi:hypothetical protein
MAVYGDFSAVLQEMVILKQLPFVQFSQAIGILLDGFMSDFSCFFFHPKNPQNNLR